MEQEGLRKSRRYLQIWSEGIADHYQKRIRAVVRVISGNPEIGVGRDSIIIRMRSSPVEEHTIYYQVGRMSIVIVAVLHTRIDVHQAFWQDAEDA